MKLMKLAILLITLMAALNLIPPLFAETIYFDNVYYTLLYLLLTFLGISIPFMVSSLPKPIKIVSNLLAGWFFSGLAYELLNFSMPDIVINTVSEKIIYYKYLVAFTVAMLFIMIEQTWKPKTSKK